MTEPTDDRTFAAEPVQRWTTSTAGRLLLLFVGASLITPVDPFPLVMADLGSTEARAAALVSMSSITGQCLVFQSE
ncbi:hypothetical protein [Halobellus clavatus]|uniref:hypothetical protein n=1 Tax=Halobellus clavatus TaxID=660517 RepID=UPI000B7CE1DC|nr:hypothetical protein [Halobellus clavatus]